MVLSTLTFARVASADVFSNVGEASGMTLVYDLNIENQATYANAASVPYVIDHAAQVNGGYTRVGYYLEFDTGSGLEWAYVSMDDFAQGRSWSLGLPHNIDNPVAHQTTVTNANVLTNAPGKVTAGTGLSTVNVEMWPGNYNGDNAASVPGTSGTAFDFGDNNTGGLPSGPVPTGTTTTRVTSAREPARPIIKRGCNSSSMRRNLMRATTSPGSSRSCLTDPGQVSIPTSSTHNSRSSSTTRTPTSAR